MGQDTNTPYTEEELYDLASKEANRQRIPELYREDAIQEFVIAAWQAGQRDGRNPRAYQYVRGRGAMIDFLREEIDVAQAVPPQCPESAMRLSFDAPTDGMDGEPTTLQEVIADPDAVIPGEEQPQQVNTVDIMAALSALTPEERKIAARVLVDGKSQREVATEMGTSRKKIRYLVENIRARIEAAYPHAASLVTR